MATAIIQHRIEDFATWKPVYDAHEGRKQYSFQDRVLQMIEGAWQSVGDDQAALARAGT